MNKYEGLERDANATIKALMSELEQASSEDPKIAAHPYKLAARRKIIVKSVWALVRRCMNMLEHQQVGR